MVDGLPNKIEIEKIPKNLKSENLLELLLFCKVHHSTVGIIFA